MKKEELAKSHYEYFSEYLKNTKVTEILQKSGLDSDPTYEEFFRTLYPTGLPDEVRAPAVYEANILFHAYHMRSSGERLYYITENLASRLANTSINVDTYFLKSPFREIFVQIDPGLFSVIDLDGTKNPVVGFYVYLREISGVKQLRIIACAILKPTPDIPFNDSVFYYRLNLGPGKIHDEVDNYFKNQIQFNRDDLERYKGKMNVDYLQDFTSFVINVLLYLTSKNPDIIKQLPVYYNRMLENIKNPVKRRKLVKRMDKAPKLPIFVAGSSIKDDRNTQAISRYGSVGKWKLSHQQKVSGHWREQWYGSAKDSTRHQEVIWIEDYIRGPDAGDVISKTIQVGKNSL